MPQLIVRREILSGQSRAFINDTPATVQLLREVAAQLIDLHGQHEHQSLLRTETHLELLDNFGSLGGLRDTYRRHYEEVARLIREREALMARRRELQEQKERYAFEIEEIDRVNPQEGEEEALEAELRILENAEQLYEATARLYELLYESENAVHDQLVLARNELQDLARIDRNFEEALQEIRSAQISVAEIAKFLQDYNARIEFNPERLEEIRARLVELELLKRKYGGTLEAVLAHRARSAAGTSWPWTSRARWSGWIASWPKPCRRFQRRRSAFRPSGARWPSASNRPSSANWPCWVCLTAASRCASRIGPTPRLDRHPRTGSGARTLRGLHNRHGSGGILHHDQPGRTAPTAGACGIGRRSQPDHARAQDDPGQKRPPPDPGLRRDRHGHLGCHRAPGG
ncbi:hypothetical protein [Rhodothermus marinus]|uniref:hypothetical protein n=1 Tax=Rhodothermus marinus TaxID=29549 RepID=UPI001FB47EA9|nr:hypothetical protein [Rhodothermus marinus]